MGKTILIVDDSPDDVELMEMALGASGHAVRTSAVLSGEAALGSLQKGGEKPALILLDLKMPGMDGFETLRRIRSHVEFRSIPVVVVTSSELPSDERAAYAAGANGYLYKAIDLMQFKRDIKCLLDQWVTN